jgi:hypothetical protein
MFEGASSYGEVADSPVLNRPSPRSIPDRGRALDPALPGIALEDMIQMRLLAVPARLLELGALAALRATAV